MFEGQRLSGTNIVKYLGASSAPPPKTIKGVNPLLQKDYGEACDCTLTSITCIIKWLSPNLEVQDIYNKVEATARKYGYKGNVGTPSLVIKNLYQNILKAFKLNKKVQSRYLKEVGFSWSYIKKEIDEGQPVLLNLWKDGRNYYKNHSVLIIGYLEFKGKRMLAIYDNWAKVISYIDYDKLNPICSIVFLTN